VLEQEGGKPRAEGCPCPRSPRRGGRVRARARSAAAADSRRRRPPASCRPRRAGRLTIAALWASRWVSTPMTWSTWSASMRRTSCCGERAVGPPAWRGKRRLRDNLGLVVTSPLP
jgi:hypothetical protein